MTIICWDGTTLAADKRIVQGGLVRTGRKLLKTPSGDLVGGAGPMGALIMMHRWWIAGGDLSAYPACQADADDWVEYLVVRPDKTVFRFERLGSPIPVEEPVAAVGSGSPFAYGAMAAGANAIKAAQIACDYDNQCGGGVEWLRLG